MNRKLLIATSLSGVLMLNAQVFSQEQDTLDYREGYNLILEQQWLNAREYFDNFRVEWPDSVWADDAAFWGCYSVEQQQTAEQVENFSCYQQFIGDFPNSSWVADARTKLAVLGAELAALGYPDYLNQVSDDWDFDFDFDNDFDFDADEISETVERAMEVAEREMERVRVEIRNVEIPDFPDFPDFPIITEDQIEEYRALARDAQAQVRHFSRRRNSADDELLTLIGALRNDERVSEILIQRLESTDNPNLRSRIVMLLEDLPGDNITSTLLDIVDNDPSELVRNSAILVLLDRDDESSRDRLLSIVGDDSYPLSVRTEIISELDDWESDEAISTLSDILQSESNPRIVAEAADALSDIETVESMDVLIEAFMTIESLELKQEILEEIADMDFDAVVQFLTEVAVSTEFDDETAATAIDGIADREDNFAVAALDTIYASTDNIQRKLAALDGLGDTETRQAVEYLTQIIGQEEDPQLLAGAVRALGDTEHVLAIQPVLTTYRNSDNEMVRNSAIRALRRLEDYPQAIEAMLEILEDRLNEVSDNQ
ncbi:MAG: HEAT repeat domain-containing protein [Pseudomonadales bacterium]|nr:HEAT repeat domain-containing protein [Pseudomonadales bacterium]